MVSSSEFSHIVKLDEIGVGQSAVHLIADARAREGLVTRFDLASLDKLEADLALSRDAKGVLASGAIHASLSQYCVATGEPVSDMIDEPVNIRFIPELVVGPNTEIELEADDCDTMFHDGQGVDLGEAVAQTLGLVLNPYPRGPEASQQLKAVGVKAEDEMQPVGALAGLKDLLAKK